MTQQPFRPSIWPDPDRPVDVKIEQVGVLQWTYTITQSGSMMATDGMAFTRAGAKRAAVRAERWLRRQALYKTQAESYKL